MIAARYSCKRFQGCEQYETLIEKHEYPGTLCHSPQDRMQMIRLILTNEESQM